MNQIFAFQLFYGSIREGHIAAVVDIGIQLVEFFAAVICDDVAVVFACFGQFFNVVVEVRRFEFAISDFAQMENGEAGGQILIIGRIL